jgi:hypothetical protein
MCTIAIATNILNVVHSYKTLRDIRLQTTLLEQFYRSRGVGSSSRQFDSLATKLSLDLSSNGRT